MIAILDWQHVGKPGRDDKGAAYDVDDDGEIDYEVELTDKYIQAAKNYLEPQDIQSTFFHLGGTVPGTIRQMRSQKVPTVLSATLRVT